jgi:DNA-binding transcriptional ArsR family regulator
MSRAARRDSPHDDRLDWIFHALSDRTRRRLLGRLTRGPAMVTELAKPFDLSLPAVSRHIKVLERARLIVRAVDGRIHRCSLDAQSLQTAEAWLERYRHFWEGTLDSLARYVEEPQVRVHNSSGTQNHE